MNPRIISFLSETLKDGLTRTVPMPGDPIGDGLAALSFVSRSEYRGEVTYRLLPDAYILLVRYGTPMDAARAAAALEIEAALSEGMNVNPVKLLWKE